MQPHELIEQVYIMTAAHANVELSDMIKQNKVSYKRDKLSQEYRMKVAQARRIAIVLISEVYGQHFVMGIYDFSYAKMKRVYNRYDALCNIRDNEFVSSNKIKLTELYKTKI